MQNKSFEKCYKMRMQTLHSETEIEDLQQAFKLTDEEFKNTKIEMMDILNIEKSKDYPSPDQFYSEKTQRGRLKKFWHVFIKNTKMFTFPI